MRFLGMDHLRQMKEGWKKEGWKLFSWKKQARKEPTALDRMKALFEQEKVPYQLISHQEAHTAPELAMSIHAPGREVAKVVIIQADERYVMAVLPAHRQIHLTRFAQVAGAKRISLAEEAEIRKPFPDCEPGAMPPLGNLYGFPVYVEESLAREPVIFFPAGTHREVIKMRFDDFQRLARPRVADFALETLKIAA